MASTPRLQCPADGTLFLLLFFLSKLFRRRVVTYGTQHVLKSLVDKVFIWTRYAIRARQPATDKVALR
ncbi:hypothetical protein MPTK1_7g15070 [Marchantia polymorpha subsp. ruderalis]|uniref:Uncharacterized protein n=2 Tax=Marchantia polymorpha TaxID=3197 RepID=A0AAF6BZS0_MARPO|nr:hypothetical protein MARPO_0009s0191 [Marchantia polymorpha]BBN17504.1 hypothetical protein Mp_7g15070 [Marchantia polymorpha subsp. ruderalis]|eukprot:PTQ47110.1 hypothetical protein MARPO_0009s0191 [Marchantia polymorpha]